MAIYVNNLSKKQKHALFAGFQFVEMLREMHPYMPMQMASVYLLIAMKPGISQRELLDLMGISQAPYLATSRPCPTATGMADLD